MKIALLILGVLIAQTALALSPGQQVPDFSARNQNGKVIHLSDYSGKFVFLYFYPKDETPGCTQEAEQLRDQYATLQSLGAVVLGVSRQDEKSHQAFIAKNKLPFDLLVDANGSIGQSLGVGSIPIVGLSQRQSLLIGRDGKLMKFYENVNPERHATDVINDLRKAQRDVKK